MNLGVYYYMFLSKYRNEVIKWDKSLEMDKHESRGFVDQEVTWRAWSSIKIESIDKNNVFNLVKATFN